MKKKIAVFVDAFYPYIDGCVNVIINYYKTLQKDFDVTIFVPKYKNADYSHFPFKVFPIKSMNLFFVKNYPVPLIRQDTNLKYFLNNNKFDLVHVHSPFSIGYFGLKYAYENDVYSIFTLHSQYRKDFRLIFKSKYIAEKLTQKMLKRISLTKEIWNVNANMENLLINKYDYNKVLNRSEIKFDVVSNATDFVKTSNDMKQKYQKEINNKHNLDDDVFVMTYIGRITNQKNIIKMIYVAYELKKINDKFRFFLIGSGNYLNKAQRLVKKLGLLDNVVFVGSLSSRDEILKYICRTNMSLFLSTYDANSLTKYEFASQSIPSMFLKKSITSSDIVNNENGYLVDYDNKNIAYKIAEIIESRSYIDIGEKAYKEIYVQWSTIVKKVKQKYNKILNKKIK